jgi:hypothetical protein
MIPFGKQQEILRELLTSSPEEVSGNCRKLDSLRNLELPESVG